MKNFKNDLMIKINSSDYYGILILYSLIYFSRDVAISLEHSKTVVVMTGIAFGLFFFGFKSENYSKLWPLIFLILLTCLIRPFHIGSVTVIMQTAYLYLMAFLFLQVNGCSEPQKFAERIQGYFKATCIIISMSVILDKINSLLGLPGPLFFAGGSTSQGLLGNQGYSGMLIVITSFFIKSYPALLIPLGALSIIYEHNTSMPLVIFVFYHVLKIFKLLDRPKNAIALFLGMVALYSTFLILEPKKLEIRGEIANMVINTVTSEAPLYGFGLGYFIDADNLARMNARPDFIHEKFRQIAFEKIKSIPSDIPIRYIHNEYLECFFAFGLIGSIPFLILLFLALKSETPFTEYKYAFHSMLALSFTWFPFHIASVCIVVIIIISVLLQTKDRRYPHV